MELSIVIVSFNTCAVTRRCLEAIMAQARDLEHEIIVVDNASSDGTVAMIRNEFPSVKIICSTENKGFAAGQNTGLRQARGAYLMILNSDVFLQDEVPLRMIERFQLADARVGVLGPQILNPDGSVAPSARRFLLARPMILLSVINRYFHFKRLLPEQFMRRRLGFLFGRWHDNYVAHDAVREVDFVDGMCFMVRRETLEQVGLFDEQFFFDQEILDLSLRIRQAGWSIEYFPLVHAVHVGHASRNLLSPIIVETQRSEFIFYSKHASQFVFFVRGAVMVVVTLRRFLARITLFFGDRRQKRAMFEIYGQILRLTRQLDPEKYREGAIIPQLNS